MHRSLVFLVLLAIVRAPPAEGQRPPDHGTAVIVVGQESTIPVPSLLSGKANQDVADLLFLRLMRLSPGLVTAGDRGFTPELARFHRRDSLTLVFDLDRRARWHDGVPVTAGDVVFAFTRSRDRTIDPQRAVLLRNVQSVIAEGDYRVVVTFAKVYGEQLYDAVWHVQPLPAHLLDTIPAERVGSSAYARAPIGNGPYRWVRRQTGRQLELAAVPNFFLGRPKIDRVIFLLARDPEAQLNLILDGTGDALENITPITNIRRVDAQENYRVIAVPTFTVGYLLFNQRAYGNRLIPHPILSDLEVRRALAMAMDRRQMIRATFGDYGAVAEGPVAQLHWIRDPSQRASRYDPNAATELLAQRGWRDSDGDGVLDRNGERLSLRLNFPGTSAVRTHLAAQAQEYLRRVGVQVDLVRLDGPVWFERRTKGEFDIDFSSAIMDPSPSGIVQSWSCSGRGGSNVGQYCNPKVDSLLEVAIADRRNPRRRWRDVIRTINADAPAIFLYAPASAAAVHRRFGSVVIRPESWWASVWRWRVTPGRQLLRDTSPPPPPPDVVRWLFRRLGQAALTFGASLLLLFLVMRVVPGDPLARLEGDVPLSAAEEALLRHRFGLDRPIAAQLGNWVSGLARGELGVSIGHYPETVGELIASRLPPTLLLGGTVLFINFTLGIWLGVLQATHRGRRLDRWLTRLSLAGYSMPSFWLGLVLISLVSLRWHLLPAAQMTDPLMPASADLFTRAIDVLRHLVLPALTLCVVTLAGTMRYQRTAMLQVLRLDFVRAARARGLSERRVIWRHAWPNALSPVLTIFGLWLPILVTGSVFVEYVFNWPGLGSLAAEAIAGRDYPLLMGTAMLASGLVVIGTVLTDAGYMILDPRVRAR